VDILSQILNDKTQDVGKQCGVFWYYHFHNNLVFSPLLSDGFNLNIYILFNY
jgi:hypothetical protein